MCRRYTTNGLISKASSVLQEMVSMLSEPEFGAAIRSLGTAWRRVAFCRAREMSSRSDLVIVMFGLVNKTNSDMTSAGQGCFQTRL